MRPPQGPAAQEAAQPRREVVDDDLRADIGRAWESLLDHSDAIADDITLTLMENGSKYYDAVGPELRADVRANTREHIRRGIRTMAGLADPEEKAIHIWRETGRRRARQGRPDGAGPQRLQPRNPDAVGGAPRTAEQSRPWHRRSCPADRRATDLVRARCTERDPGGLLSS